MERTTGQLRTLTWLIVGLILFSYANQLIFHYQVPPGGDAINHQAVTQQILNGQWAAAAHYHFVWHALVAVISIITHARSITVMAWLGPMLLVSGGVTLFFFNKKYFGWVAGLTTLALFGFFSRQPLQTLYDGGFPDVLAGATILPLTIIALEKISSSSRRVPWTLAFIGLLVLLLFSHHLTFLLAVGFMAIYGLIQLMLVMKERVWSWSVILATPLLLGAILLLLGSFFLKNATTSAAALASMFTAINWHWPFLHFIGQVADPNQIADITAYPNAIGEALVYLGLFGLPVVMGYFVAGSRSPKGRIALVLLLWLTVLAVGSRNPHLGFPSRLMRDLAIPLALLGGVFLQAVADFFQARSLPKWLWVVIVVLAFGTGWETFLERTKASVTANPLIYHLPTDTEMADWMSSSLPPDSIIAAFPGDIYLPLFVTNQTVIAGLSDEVKQKITDPAQIPSLLPQVQYVYFTYRLDQPTTWDNNQSNVNSYKKSAVLKLTKSVRSSVEQIYLFKVVKPVKKVTASVSRP